MNYKQEDLQLDLAQVDTAAEPECFESALIEQALKKINFVKYDLKNYRRHISHSIH